MHEPGMDEDLSEWLDSETINMIVKGKISQIKESKFRRVPIDLIN